MARNDIDPHEETKAETAKPGKMTAGGVIGGYELLDVLGEGGMGVVWSAHDPDLDRTLAIKVLKRSDAAPALRKRLLREARAMARLKHPNVLTVYKVGTEGDRDFIAMELVEGGSLDEWLDRQPPRDLCMAAVLAAGRGLAAAHRAGLVHRDFKPHNILRSNDGRVLVTDFGLARGMGDDSASADGEVPTEAAALDTTIRPQGTSARTTDSLLDSPLTQTGALIGTPAYMAPEQFLGAAPDPRTDQFAFCVTAWQALTGMRPYTGASLDELRENAGAGIAASVKVDLPPEIRAALVRGLDPDPEKRWPAMDDLLEVLDDAVRPKRPRWLVPVLGLAVVGLVAGAVLIARRGGTAAPPIAAGCAPGEDAFAETWSPQKRSELARVLDGRGIQLGEAQFARLADPLDAYRERWTQQLATACKAPERIGVKQRACLLGARDQTAALVLVLREGPPELYGKIDLHGMLPDLGGCAVDNPSEVVSPPDDPVLRDKVVHLMAKALALGARPDFVTAFPAVEEEARSIGWPPMLPLVQMGFGNELLRRGERALARAEMRKIIDAAPETRGMKTVAVARFGMLDASLVELEQPRTDSKPGELHHEIDRLLIYARKDVKLAGNDPTLVAGLAGYEARAQAALAQWGRYPKAYDEALAQARKAAAAFQAAGDQKRAARMTALVANILVERGGSSALDDAMFAARTADEALAAAKVDHEPALDEVRAWIELMRGEYFTAEQLYARDAGRPAAPRGVEHTGTVTDATGKPIANARVVVWRGTLIGDPRGVITDLSKLDGERTEAGAGGTFTVHAEPGDAVIAELADQRSVPQLVGAGALALHLEPTTTLTGTIDRADLSDVWVAARYAIGANVFELRVPARKDRSFTLDNLPRGTPVIATTGAAMQGQRRIIAGAGATKLTWPVGQTIEVIARGVPEGATAWIFRGMVDPKTRAEVEALAARAADVAWAELVPVGGDNTDAGRAVYEPGDRHAVIGGNSTDTVTVCVDQPQRPACRAVMVKRGSIDEPPEVTPVIFDSVGRGTPRP